MKAIRKVIPGLAVIGLVMFTGTSAMPAEPAGELVLAGDQWGVEMPLPGLESNQGIDYMKLLYDSLVGTTPDGKLSPEDGVANRWEMSRDAFTWTFHLRKGIKFHDGVELTANDAKFSLDRILQPDCKIPGASDIRLAIKSVEVKSPYTLIVNCKKPSIFLPSLLSDDGYTAGLIHPKGYYERVGKDKAVKNPVGSGPYKWHSQLSGSFIKLEAANKHWRDGILRYKYVTFRMVPEEFTRIAMLKTGEVDIVRISRGKVKEMLDAGLNLCVKEDANLIVFRPGNQWASPVFSDIRFRKALNLAVDREAIVKRVLEGRAKPTVTYPGMNILACGGDPNLKPYPYDPEEAKRLIKQGGYTGHEFIVPSYTRDAAPELPVIVETLCNYWEKIGLKPKIVNLEWLTFREKLRKQDVANQVFGNASAVSRDCPENITRLRLNFHSKGEQTTCRIPEIDTMIEKAEKSLDPAEVLSLLGNVHRYAYQNYLDIPICDIGQDIATTRRVPKWDPGARRMGMNLNDVIRQR